MNAKDKNMNKKEISKKDHKKEVTVKPEVFARQLNRDTRDAVLVVSVLVNAYVLIGWLVLQVSDKFDASLIGYLQR